MNHPSECKKNYHPQRGKYAWKHKGTGVISDTLFKIVKKPLIGILKKTAEKASNIVVKKAGDKIGEILRKRSGQDEVRKRKAPKTNSVVTKKTNLKHKK